MLMYTKFFTDFCLQMIQIYGPEIPKVFLFLNSFIDI